MMEEKPASLEETIETPPMEPSSTELPTSSFGQKLRANKFKILGGVLGVFVFAGAVFGSYKLGQGRIVSPQPTPTPELVATPTPDPTANWKTYTNTDQKWLFRYPPNWEREEVVDGGVIFRAPGTGYQEPTLKVVTGAEVRILLLPWKYSGDITSLEQEIGPVPESDITIVAVERIIVAGQTAVKTISEGVGGRSISVSVPRETEVYQIALRSLEESYQDTYNLMLSTFKFLEEPTPPPSKVKEVRIPQKLVDTSSWISKTYSNLYVSFKVPPTWQRGEEEINYKNLLRRVWFDDPDWYGSYDFSVSLYNNPQNLGRREFWWQEAIKGKPPFSQYGIQYVQDVLEWKIDGKEALSLYFTEYSGGGTYLMVPKSNQIIVIFFNGNLLERGVFETVLSTFRFLE